MEDALTEHQKRDSTILRVIDLAFFASVAFLCRHLAGWDFVAVLVAVWAGTSGLHYFIDQSNRNFYLHRLDWENAGPDEPRS